MKIEFFCNSGANINSCRREVVDIGDWGVSDEEWDGLTENQKFEMAQEWANDRLEIGYKEIK